MENLVQVPFDVEMAKKITNKEIEGRIVTRGGRSARIICFDRKSDGDLHIVALVNIGGEEEIETYMLNGIWMKEGADSLDLMLEIPEYLTFKDGDVIATCDGLVAIYKSYGIESRDAYSLYVALREDELFLIGNKEWYLEGARKATEEEKQKLIEAMKRSTEPKAKDYLKCFFSIEKDSKSLKIEEDCKFNTFDKVLVRNSDEMEWIPRFFERYVYTANGGRTITMDGNSWKQCIHYEGNEYLQGTSDNP